MTDNIVEDWLKSIDLEIYTEAFLDNGYDELEVCKQIGEPDLDAIGVTNETHREIILQAVIKIKEEGATSVYFTLETSEVAVIDPNLSEKQGPTNRRNSANVETPRAPSRVSCVGVGGPEEMVTLYPRAQLRMIIRDKLVQDNIDLLSPPYTRRDWTPCHSSMMTLAAKYAIQLKTRSSDVVERLEELRQWVLHKDLQSQDSPSTSHMDSNRLMKVHTYNSRQDASLYSGNYMTIGSSGFCCLPLTSSRDSNDGDKMKKTSSLGRFFRNMGIRRSGKKNQYKPHDGDLCATDITMGDEDRKTLMMMVKDGSLTTEQAMAMVKQYEEERRREWQQQQGNHKGTQKKKKQGGKPVKSPSATYHDIVTRCQVCQRFLSNDPSQSSPNFCNDPSHRFECYQHRRVHSVSHIEFNNPSAKSPEAARAMSCTPTRGFYSPSEVNSPVSFYSPGHPRLYSPVFPHEGKIYHTGSLYYGQHGNFHPHHSSFHESPSAMSSFSMESEHSMECQSNALTPGELAATRGDHWNYSTYSSTMSTGSDTSPASGWRKISEGGDPMKMQKVRNQSGTNKSISSVDSSQSGGSGKMSTHSASPGSGKSNSSMEAEGMLGTCNHDNNTSSLVRVHTDYTPSQTEADMLHIKKGDIIWVATRTAGSLWKGVLSGKTGWFRPSYTEPCSHSNSEGNQRRTPNPRRTPRKTKPRTVEELLCRLGLEILEKVFLENGFEHLESFADLNESDLDALGIMDPQQRAKLLTAAELLCSAEEDEFPEMGTPNGLPSHVGYCYSPRLMTIGDCHHRACPGSRDSGCYGSWEHLGHKDVLNKQGYMISPKSQNSRVSPLQYNKENLQPVNQNRTIGDIRYVCSRQANSSGRGSASSGRTSVENCGGESQTSDMERSDRDFTEEDREVCEINLASRKGDTSCVHPGEHVTPQAEENPVFGDFTVIMCSYASTQTSSHGERDNGHSQFSNSVKGQSNGATECERSKPFSNKVVIKSKNSKKDAQVQVMCPFGPLSVVPEANTGQVRQDCLQRQRGSNDSTPTRELQGGRALSSLGAITSQGGQVQYNDNKVPNHRPKSVDSSRPVSSPKDFRSVKKSLVSLITAKLADEKINLSQEPYSTKQGECRIPPPLIQRYSEELKHDLASVCTVLEQVRMHSLTTQHRPVIQMENLVDRCNMGSELKTTSIPDFFTSIGLPMYISAVIGQNYKYLEQLFKLTSQEIREITGAPHKHAKRIFHALSWVKKKMTAQNGNDESGLIDRV
ncbi:SAM and SH3 domain-containing protein 1-like isoform X5 [Crassostrea virginica]